MIKCTRCRFGRSDGLCTRNATASEYTGILTGSVVDRSLNEAGDCPVYKRDWAGAFCAVGCGALIGMIITIYVVVCFN